MLFLTHDFPLTKHIVAQVVSGALLITVKRRWRKSLQVQIPLSCPINESGVLPRFEASIGKWRIDVHYILQNNSEDPYFAMSESHPDNYLISIMIDRGATRHYFLVQSDPNEDSGITIRATQPNHKQTSVTLDNITTALDDDEQFFLRQKDWLLRDHSNDFIIIRDQQILGFVQSVSEVSKLMERLKIDSDTRLFIEQIKPESFESNIRHKIGRITVNELMNEGE